MIWFKCIYTIIIIITYIITTLNYCCIWFKIRIRITEIFLFEIIKSIVTYYSRVTFISLVAFISFFAGVALIALIALVAVNTVCAVCACGFYSGVDFSDPPVAVFADKRGVTVFTVRAVLSVCAVRTVPAVLPFFPSAPSFPSTPLMPSLPFIPFLPSMPFSPLAPSLPFSPAAPRSSVSATRSCQSVSSLYFHWMAVPLLRTSSRSAAVLVGCTLHPAEKIIPNAVSIQVIPRNHFLISRYLRSKTQSDIYLQTGRRPALRPPSGLSDNIRPQTLRSVRRRGRI